MKFTASLTYNYAVCLKKSEMHVGNDDFHNCNPYDCHYIYLGSFSYVEEEANVKTCYTLTHSFCVEMPNSNLTLNVSSIRVVFPHHLKDITKAKNRIMVTLR
jgi:hypothetical protein